MTPDPAPCPCALCKALAQRVAELERTVTDLTTYAGSLHDQLAAAKGASDEAPGIQE